MLARSEPDPCAPGIAALDQALNDDHIALLGAIVPGTSRDLVDELVQRKQAWRDTHLQSCRAKQPVATAACLEARRIELAGTVEDLIADRGREAKHLVELVGDPRACAKPASGLLAAQVPADPVLRRKVTAVRYQLYATEAARDRDDPAAVQLARDAFDAGATVWPPLRAELIYLRGTVEMMIGDTKRGSASLREAAAFAEAVHYDYVAAGAWTSLAQIAALDEADPARGLEYGTYAESAVARIGNPPDQVASLALMQGSALVEADRIIEGEAMLREALRLAESSAPRIVGDTQNALGYVFEIKGQFAEAVAMYRRSLANRVDEPSIFVALTQARIAIDLASLKQFEEAEKTARDAVALGARGPAKQPIDQAMLRLDLADVLERVGHYAEALKEARWAAAEIARLQGERSAQYASALQVEALCLLGRQQAKLAEQKLRRACDILAFQLGPQAGIVATCMASHARALTALGRKSEARAVFEDALPTLTQTLGIDHPATKSVRDALERLDGKRRE